jgi:hypothetical protein
MKKFYRFVFGLIIIILLWFVAIQKPAYARLGENACAEMQATIIYAKFHDISGKNNLAEFLDYFYTVKVKILDVKVINYDPNQQVDSCNNFTKAYYSNAIVNLTIETDVTERPLLLPGQQIHLRVFGSGYALITENGIITPWSAWLIWALLIVFLIAAIWLIVLGFRRRSRKKV